MMQVDFNLIKTKIPFGKETRTADIFISEDIEDNPNCMVLI